MPFKVTLEKQSEPVFKRWPEKSEQVLRIIKAVAGTTNNDDPCVTVDYKVVGGDFDGDEVRFHKVTFFPPGHKGAYFSGHFLRSIDEPSEGSVVVNEANWIGKLILASVKLGDPTDKGYRYPKVDKVIGPGYGVSADRKEESEDSPF